MDIQINRDSISIDGTEYHTSYPIEDSVITTQRIILLLGSWQLTEWESADLVLDEDHQNLISVNSSGNVEWKIEKHEHDGYHRYIFDYQDRTLSRFNGCLCDINIRDGTISQTWSDECLPVGETLVEVDGRISSVLEVDDKVIVSCRGEHEIYGFSADGEELWRSDAKQRRGQIYVEDGELREVVAVGREKDDYYRLDPTTGDRVESWSNYE